MSDYGWESPIKIITKNIGSEIDGEVIRVVNQIVVDVDEKRLVEALEHDRSQYVKGYNDGYKAAQHWIPASIKPEKPGDYLVFNGYGSMRADRYTGVRWCVSYHVVAWMPLPEEYKEEQ